jgi:hypothetical protein
VLSEEKLLMSASVLPPTSHQTGQSASSALSVNHEL